MNITLSQIKEDAGAKLHGNSLNKVPGNFYRHCLEAANRVLNKINPKTTIRSANITNALYSEVYDYLAPSDLKGNKVNDIKVQYGRPNSDTMFASSSREFDIKKYFNSMNVKEKDGLKFLRISKQLGSNLTLNTCDSETSDGEWVEGGDASGLTINTYQKISGHASLEFNLSGLTGQGGLSVDDMSPKSVEDLSNFGAIFLGLFWGYDLLPNSVTLKWGSDPSNYFSKTVTTPHEYTTFRNGWNMLRFDFDTAVETGTVDMTNLTYLDIEIDYPTGNVFNGILLDNIVIARRYPFEVEYYSTHFFRSSGGVYKIIPTADSDIINADTMTYNIFLYELMDILAQITQAEEGATDRSYFRKQLDMKEAKDGESGLYEQYNSEYPSESLIESNDYYDFGFDSNQNDLMD